MGSRLRRVAPPLAPAMPAAPLLSLASARSGGPARRLSLAIQAAKGFGKPKPATRPAEDEGKGGRKGGKAKRVQLQPGSVGPIPNQNRQPGAPQDGSAAQFQTQLLVPEVVSEEEDEFNARLMALKAAGAERAAAAVAASPAAAAAAAPAIFDATPASAPTGAASGGDGGDIYANPPPLAQTLLTAAGGGAAASDISDPKLRDANIGPSQLGLAAGAILFIAVFVIVAAGDYAPSSRRYSGVRPAQAPPDPIEEKILKGKVSLYEEQLRADPTNDDATEGLATSYAKLMQYDKAAELLEKLSKRNPTDAEVWRLLGESSLLSQQPRKAVPAFERAVELRRSQQQPSASAGSTVVLQPDLQLLTGLVDAYIANSDYPKAIEALKGVREQLRSAASAATASASVSSVEASSASSSSGEAVEPQAAAPEAQSAAPEVAEAPEASSSAPAMLAAPPLTDEPAAATAAPAAASSSQPAAPAPASRGSSSSSLGAAVRPLDPVGVELLTAKVYSAWRGHDQDALATYDELTKAFSEDYRGYLAKGVFLKEKGRKADAERMFLQARFFAPASKQQLVRAIADSTPAAPQLPDNN